MLKRTKKQISFNMSQIRSKDTSIERILAASLKNAGITYKRNYSKVFGKPDFVILRRKTVIFCDSAFWHGYRNMRTKIHDFKSRRKFWTNKISSNIERDKEVNRILKRKGWRVIRFWDFEIKNAIERCISKITELSNK